MSEEAKAVTTAFTIRNVPEEIDKCISAIAQMEGVSKNTLLLNLLDNQFSNPISNYGRKSALVKIMDAEVCSKYEKNLLSNWYENEHIIKAKLTYKKLLNIKSEEILDAIFKKNISLIDLRAFQFTSRNGGTNLPAGISLTFALFVEIARQSEDIIAQFHCGLFNLSENFVIDINEIRISLSLHELDPQKYAYMPFGCNVDK